jgi:hypothetical protein
VEVEAARRVLNRLLAAERSTVEADVALLLARAAVHASLCDPIYAREARGYLDRLCALEIRKDSRVGWGLSFAHDTFSKGKPNSADTIYAYTTAAAGLAFLDAAIVLGEPRWAERADEALQTLFSPEFTQARGRSLIVWYSDEPLDQRPEYLVYNTNALVLGLASRIDRDRPQPRYVRERAALTRLLVRSQGVGLDGAKVATVHNWRYCLGRPKINDLIHEAFIVEGLLEAGTPKARRAAQRSLAEMWDLHFDGRGQPGQRHFTLGSRGWGPPAALSAFCAARGFASEAAADVARSLATTIDSTGRATLARNGNPRGEAWYALGLWRFAARGRAPELSPR